MNTHINDTRQWRYETRAAATVRFIQLFIVLAYMLTYMIILLARHVTKRQAAQLEANLLEMEERLAERKKASRKESFYGSMEICQTVRAPTVTVRASKMVSDQSDRSLSINTVLREAI